jgi:sugar lactone lactonase YvrE
VSKRRLLWSSIAESEERFVLAEGPQWDAATSSFSWVDIEGRSLTVANLAQDGRIVIREVRNFDDRVTFAHPLDGGRYLIGLGQRLAVSASGGLTDVSAPLVSSDRRLNDAAIDPQGRLIVGTMSLEGRHERNLLLRIESDGTVTCVDNDLGLSNGIGFAPDGATLYSTDSTNGVIYRRSYLKQGSVIGAREAFARFVDVEPDGMTVDTEGRVWIALWGGGGVQVLEPDGATAAFLSVPAEHVTSVQLGGSEALALVTTSMLLLDEDERRASPSAGRVGIYRTNARPQPRPKWSEISLADISETAAPQG